MNKEKEILTLRNTLKMYASTLSECLNKTDNDLSISEIINSMCEVNNDYKKLIYVDKLVNNKPFNLLNTNLFIVHLPLNNIETHDILGFYPVSESSIAVNLYDTTRLPIFELEKHLKNKDLLKGQNITVEYLDLTGVVQYKKVYYNVSLNQYQQTTPNAYNVEQPRVFTVVFNYDRVEVEYRDGATN